LPGGDSAALVSRPPPPALGMSSRFRCGDGSGGMSGLGRGRGRAHWLGRFLHDSPAGGNAALVSQLPRVGPDGIAATSSVAARPLGREAGSPVRHLGCEPTLVFGGFVGTFAALQPLVGRARPAALASAALLDVAEPALLEPPARARAAAQLS